MRESKFITNYPGDGYYYVICDICGKKIRQKDAVLISDKYNTHNGLLVCKEDADVTNQQEIPIFPTERNRIDGKTSRSEPYNNYVVNEASDRVPGAPRNLQATPHPINSTVILYWQGPIDCGSDSIDGYIITRAEPQYSVQVTIATTSSASTYYEDVTADVNTHYSYVIYAFNSVGTGTASNMAFYPTEDVDNRYLTFIVDENNNVIATENGEFIVREES